MILAHCNLRLRGSSDSPASASRSLTVAQAGVQRQDIGSLQLPLPKFKLFSSLNLSGNWDYRRGFTMLARLASNSLPQVIRPSRPPKVLDYRHEHGVLPCHPVWNAVTQSQFTAAFTSSSTPFSASQVAGTSGMHHHAQLITGDPLRSVSLGAGITELNKVLLFLHSQLQSIEEHASELPLHLAIYRNVSPVWSNPFDQFFEDELDPFKVLKAAEN
ncbi:putative uncharacterized protein CCDC28A-AS1 [Plecturocebus cupreus]